MSKILEYKNRLKKSKDFCYPHWSRFIDNYKHYLSRLSYKIKGGSGGEDIEKENKYPFASQITTGISFDTIETIMPRIIGRDPEFVTAAIEPEDIPYEQTAKMTIEYEYQNPKLHLLGEPIYLKLQKAVREALITGTSVMRAYWRRETIKRAVYKAKIGEKEGEIKNMEQLAKKMGLEMEYVKKYEETPFLDDFDVKHLPFFFFFPDPVISETGLMRYKIERAFYTKEQLIAEAQIFNYDKNVLKDLFENKQTSFYTPEIDKDFMYQYSQLFHDGGLASDLSLTDDDKMALYTVDKMWEGGKVYVFVNEKYNLTGEEGIKSPYDLIKDPFIFTYNIPQPHLFYGRSELDAIKRLEDGINDLTNMRADNLFQAMSSIYLVNPKVLENASEFAPYPNSVWNVKDINLALREIKGQDVTAAVYKETDTLYQYIQRISGITDYTRGAEGITLAGRTYGGLRLAQEVANARFAIKTTLFEQVTLRSLGYMMLEMARQFFDKDRIARLTGQAGEVEQEFYTIEVSKLKSIKGYMDIQVIPSSTRAIDEQAEAMKLNGLLDRMGSGKPPFDKMTPNLYYRFLLKYLPLFGFHDAIYWIREMRKSETSQLVPSPEPQHQAQPETNLPVNMGEVMTTKGVQSQPNPLEQILANQSEIPNNQI